MGWAPGVLPPTPDSPTVSLPTPLPPRSRSSCRVSYNHENAPCKGSTRVWAGVKGGVGGEAVGEGTGDDARHSSRGRNSSNWSRKSGRRPDSPLSRVFCDRTPTLSPVRSLPSFSKTCLLRQNFHRRTTKEYGTKESRSLTQTPTLLPTLTTLKERTTKV